MRLATAAGSTTNNPGIPAAPGRLFRCGAALAAASLLALAAGCGAAAEKAADASEQVQKPVPVTVAPVERRPVERTVEVVGTLKGWEQVTVGSKRTGRVATVLHDMGDKIDPNAMLVELETVDADLAVEQAQRQLEAELARLGLKEMPGPDFDVATVPAVVQAQVALDRARQNLARERSLIQRNAGTAQDYQNAENDERAAVAALENAILTARSTLAGAQASKAALDVARQARVDMEIRAPVPSAPPPGLENMPVYALSRRDVSEGQMIREGEPIAELVIEDPLRLWTNVPERFSAEVAVGQDVRVRVASHPGQVFQGKVARINPAVDPVSRSFQVETAVPNPDGLLRPGGFAKASILTDTRSEAITVPLESVIRFAGVTKLFVVSEDRPKPRALAVEVTTGLEGPGWIEVRGKLPSQAQVVTTGQTQLADGSPIVIRDPAAEADAEAEAEAEAGSVEAPAEGTGPEAPAAPVSAPAADAAG